MTLRIKLWSIIFLLLLVANPSVANTDGVALHPAHYAYLGVLLVNGATALGNGITLLTGNPHRTNGKFGLMTGTATAVLAGVLFAVAHESDLDRQAAAILGGAGIASALTGGLVMRAAGKNEEGPRLLPTVSPREKGFAVGLNLRF